MHILKKKLVRIESSADSFLLVGQQVSLFPLCFMFGMKKKKCAKKQETLKKERMIYMIRLNRRDVKGALCSFGGKNLIKRERSPLTDCSA